MRSIVFLAICLVAAQAAALDKAVVEEEVSRAPAPFKALAVNNAVGGNLPGLSAAACPLVMKTNTQITPFPIRSDAVCDSFGLGQANNLYACAAFGQMGSILGKPDLRCAPDAIPLHPDTDTAGVPIPQPLPDRRQGGVLPEQLPHEVLQTEGATYSWLHSYVQSIYLHTTCAEQGNNTPWKVPAGWNMQKMVHIANGNNVAMMRMKGKPLKAASLPFMAILTKSTAARAATNSACQSWATKAAAGTATAGSELCEGGVMLFVIRGTATSYEWSLDYQYNMVPDSNYGPGMFHEGFLAVVNQLWNNGMQEALDTAVAAGDIKHIIITGHSLGGASTTLLSARAQAYLEKAVAARKQGAAQPPKISAVMFGGANVGDAAFAEHFNTRVNARHVQFKYDTIRQVPCQPQITACTALTVPVPTSKGSTTGAWSYKRVGGQVNLDVSDIPMQQEVWSKISVLTQQDFCRSQDSVVWNVDAGHYCSYFCSLGAYAGQRTWCKLYPESDAKTDKGSSYCFQGVAGAAYPKAPLYPFQ